MAQSTARQRVAIAGTVTNVATEEGIPQVLVRITQAPAPFVVRLLEIIRQDVSNRPKLAASYQHLFAKRRVTADTLRTAQIILEAFEHHHWLSAPRPDQTITGGDGHYCFFDLPPGTYGLTATFTAPNYCHGVTQGQVEVQQSHQWLAFSELDLAMTLVPNQLSIPTSREALSPLAPEPLNSPELLLCRS
jgi:hypothetical protein